MRNQDIVLQLPVEASGSDWDACLRTAQEECPGILVHRGQPAPLASQYIRLAQPVLFAPGSISNLLRTLDSGVASVVPVCNGAQGENGLHGIFPDPGLGDHPNNRFHLADYLHRQHAGKTRTISVASPICVASRSPTPYGANQTTLALDAFIYVFPVDPPISVEDSMTPGLSALPAFCVRIHTHCPDPTLTLANVARPGAEVLLLNSLPGYTPPAGVDCWSVTPDTTWGTLHKKMQRWFGNRKLLYMDAGLIPLPAQLARLASLGNCTGAIEDPATGARRNSPSVRIDENALLDKLPFAWAHMDLGQGADLQLESRPDAYLLGKVDHQQSLKAEAQPNHSGLPDAIHPWLLGFDRLLICGKGQIRDLSGQTVESQIGCDALMWKLEPGDIYGLHVRLRKLREAGCRRLVVTLENNFFETTDGPYTHIGCSPIEVRRELHLAGFAIQAAGAWPDCQTASVQENYFDIRRSIAHWTPEETLLATHSRLWFAADACTSTLQKRPRVSVVLLALNKLEYTRKCIESLRKHCTLDLELILVDNGSTDGTFAYFQSIPGAKAIRNEINRGVAAGWNQGLRVATGEYILILNNDTIVAPGTIENLVRCAQNHPGTGMVSPRSNRIAGPQQVEGFTYRDESEIIPQAIALQNVNALSCWEFFPLKGFCMLLPREVVQKVGEFDEQFGIGNFEDDDYSQRVLSHGYRLLVADDSFLFHFGSVSFGQANIDWDALMQKNQALYDAKWEKGRGAAFVPSTAPILAPPPPSVRAKEFLPSESELRARLASDELDADAYYLLGKVLLQRSDKLQAFANWCKSLECDPARTEVANDIAHLLNTQFSESETRDVLDFLRRRFPFAKAFQQKAHGTIPQNASGSSQSLNAEGIELYGQARYTEALDKFLQSYAIEENDDCVLNLYDCALRIRRPDIAKPRLEKSLRANPRNNALRSAWQELLALGEPTQIAAEQVIYFRECNQAIEELMEAGHYDEARDVIQKTLAEQPRNYRALNSQGVLALYRNDLVAAQTSFQASLQSNPYFTDAADNLFDSAWLAGRIPQVRHDIEYAISLQPGDAALQDLAKHLREGSTPLRLQAYSSAAQPIPIENSKPAVVDLNSADSQRLAEGNSLLEQGDFNRATILFTDILQQHPENVEALNGVGICAYQRGNIDDARMLFAHALKFKPLDQDTLLNYWEACCASGKKAEALDVLRRALTLDPALDAIAAIVRGGGLS